MEDPKIGCVGHVCSFFKIPWVKSLVAFIIFLAIFIAGVRFGEHNSKGGDFRSFGNDSFRSQPMGRGNFDQNYFREINSVDDNAIAPQDGQGGVSQKQQVQGTEPKSIPTTSNQ